jgi:hypothetical protein
MAQIARRKINLILCEKPVLFFSADLLPRLATQFTTTPPHLPRRKPRSAHPFSQKCLQNTTSTTPEKTYKMYRERS